MKAETGRSMATARRPSRRDGDRRWARRPLVRRLRLQRLDGVGEHLRVEVEADRRDVPALLRAQQVARAADLEVAQRDLEAGAQLGRLEDGREALLRDLGRGAVLRECSR